MHYRDVCHLALVALKPHRQSTYNKDAIIMHVDNALTHLGNALWLYYSTGGKLVSSSSAISLSCRCSTAGHLPSLSLYILVSIYKHNIHIYTYTYVTHNTRVYTHTLSTHKMVLKIPFLCVYIFFARFTE